VRPSLKPELHAGRCRHDLRSVDGDPARRDVTLKQPLLNEQIRWLGPSASCVSNVRLRGARGARCRMPPAGWTAQGSSLLGDAQVNCCTNTTLGAHRSVSATSRQDVSYGFEPRVLACVLGGREWRLGRDVVFFGVVAFHSSLPATRHADYYTAAT